VEPRRILVMLGPPGAGKGTQAALLSEELGIPKVSTGDLFRNELRAKGRHADEIATFVGRGQLVPDPLTLRVVSERLAQPDARPGAILDGFPRTRPQAEALDRMLGKDGGSVTKALYIEVDTPEVIRRLAGRRVCKGPEQHVYHLDWQPPEVPGVCDIDGSPLEQRPDDRPETIRARLDRQLPPMFEVVDHYAEQGILSAVRGDRPIEQVAADLLQATSRAVRRG
jgi:adenylate kinase